MPAHERRSFKYRRHEPKAVRAILAWPPSTPAPRIVTFNEFGEARTLRYGRTLAARNALRAARSVR